MNFVSSIGLIGGFVTTMAGMPQIYHMQDTKGVGWGMLSITTFYGIFFNFFSHDNNYGWYKISYEQV